MSTPSKKRLHVKSLITVIVVIGCGLAQFAMARVKVPAQLPYTFQFSPELSQVGTFIGFSGLATSESTVQLSSAIENVADINRIVGGPARDVYSEIFPQTAGITLIGTRLNNSSGVTRVVLPRDNASNFCDMSGEIITSSMTVRFLRDTGYQANGSTRFEEFSLKFVAEAYAQYNNSTGNYDPIHDTRVTYRAWVGSEVVMGQYANGVFTEARNPYRSSLLPYLGGSFTGVTGANGVNVDLFDFFYRNCRNLRLN